MSKPHSRRDAFTRDVSEYGKNPGSVLREGGEVAGNKAGGEDFAGKLQLAAAQHPRPAQLALDLHGVKNLRVQIHPLAQ